MKKALVTGGSRGIGAAVCRALARDGWMVYVNYNESRDKALALAEEIGGKALWADVSDPAAVAAMFAQAGDLDLLVSNAGIAGPGLVQDLTDEDWLRLFRVNADGAFYSVRAAVPGMVRRKRGNIIIISSVCGVWGSSCEAAYSDNKGALIAMTKSLFKELGPSGIRVNVVSPGCIATEMLARFDEAELAALREETPLGRLGTPEDVAACVRFLASEEASFVTGQVLGVNGGFGL
jgi:3-oxoacyl-[acyl-carrier protein] reductase